METPDEFNLGEFLQGIIIPPSQAAVLQSGQGWRTNNPEVDVEAQLQAFASAAAAAAAAAPPAPSPLAIAAPSPQVQQVQQENQGEQLQQDMHDNTSAGPAHQELEDARHAVANLTAALVAGDTPSKSGKAQRTSPLMLQQSPQKSTSRSPPVPFAVPGHVEPTQHVSPTRPAAQVSPRRPIAAVQPPVLTDGTAPMSIDGPVSPSIPPPQAEPMPEQQPESEFSLLPMTQVIPFGGTPPREKIVEKDIIEGSGQVRTAPENGALGKRSPDKNNKIAATHPRLEKPARAPTPADKSTPQLVSPTSASKAKAKGWINTWGLKILPFGFGRSPLTGATETEAEMEAEAEVEVEAAPQQPGQDSVAPEVEEEEEEVAGQQGATSESPEEEGEGGAAEEVEEVQGAQAGTEEMQIEQEESVIPATQAVSLADASEEEIEEEQEVEEEEQELAEEEEEQEEQEQEEEEEQEQVEEDEGDAVDADRLDIPPTQFQFPPTTTQSQEAIIETAPVSMLDASFGPAEATAAPLAQEEHQSPVKGLLRSESESQDNAATAAAMAMQQLGDAQTEDEDAGDAAEAEAVVRTGESPPSPAPAVLFPASSTAVAAVGSPGTWGAAAPGGMLGGYMFTQDPNMMATQEDMYNTGVQGGDMFVNGLAGGWTQPASSPVAAPRGEAEEVAAQDEEQEEEEQEEMPAPPKVGTRRTRAAAAAAIRVNGMEFQQRKKAKPTAIIRRPEQAQQQQQQEQGGAPEAPQAAGVYMAPPPPPQLHPTAPPVTVAANAPPAMRAATPRHGAPINLPQSTLAARRKLQELRAQRQAQAAAAAAAAGSAHGHGAQGGYPVMPQQPPPAIAMPGLPGYAAAPPPHMNMNMHTPGNPAMMMMPAMSVHNMPQGMPQGMPQYTLAPYQVGAGGYAMQMMPPPVLGGGQYTAATPSAQQGSAMGPPQFPQFIQPEATGQSTLGKLLSILAPPGGRGA